MNVESNVALAMYRNHPCDAGVKEREEHNADNNRGSLFGCTTVNLIAAREKVDPVVVERALVLVGCIAFVWSGIEGIIGSKQTSEYIEHSLTTLGSCCYAGAVSAAWCLQNAHPQILNRATAPLLVGTLASFLSFGILQYVEGGSGSILCATALFSGAIVARGANHTLKSMAGNGELQNVEIVGGTADTVVGSAAEKDSPALLASLFVHYTFATVGAFIFLYDSSVAANQKRSLGNPALGSATGAAAFLAAKSLGFSLTMRDIIKLRKSDPASRPLLDDLAANA